MSASNLPASEHPDLRELIAAALNQLGEPARAPSPYNRRDFAPDELIIRCQRTWTNVASRDPRMQGGDFSACIAQFEREGTFYAFFVEAHRGLGEAVWQWSGTSGGGHGSEPPDRAGGFGLSGGSHVALGGLGAVPAGGTLQVEHADGSRYEAREQDGCAIVFAPITSEPARDDEVIVRRIDADGTVLSVDRTWIGDGGPPPPGVFSTS